MSDGAIFVAVCGFVFWIGVPLRRMARASEATSKALTLLALLAEKRR